MVRGSVYSWVLPPSVRPLPHWGGGKSRLAAAGNRFTVLGINVRGKSQETFFTVRTDHWHWSGGETSGGILSPYICRFPADRQDPEGKEQSDAVRAPNECKWVSGWGACLQVPKVCQLCWPNRAEAAWVRPPYPVSHIFEEQRKRTTKKSPNRFKNGRPGFFQSARFWRDLFFHFIQIGKIIQETLIYE